MTRRFKVGVRTLKRDDKKRIIARVRIYILQGMSFEDAKRESC